VLQICDNKSHLAKLYEINKEAVGFDTIAEAIELCRYYLEHDRERREIAAAGWKRAIRDYNETATFQLIEKYVRELDPTLEKKQTRDPRLYLRSKERKRDLYHWRALNRNLSRKTIAALRPILRRLRVKVKA
jgi:hypothetical protein